MQLVFGVVLNNSQDVDICCLKLAVYLVIFVECV